MGMFDYIKCKYPLPVDGANNLDYQSKDTEAQQLDNYEIREDGTVWHENYDTRYQPVEVSLLGFRLVRVNRQWEKVRSTGEIRFHAPYMIKGGMLVSATSYNGNGWLEWSAYIVDGVVNQMKLIKNRQPESVTQTTTL